ncbi:hypothetical protein TL16_g05471 [Triparma laevis f. inornata]|uniref:tRNA-guanosine(34) queuine transglycosylase n=1 Tax=Triparma laevis f. inornata TaxID=1714386 RepID=A0A9W7AJU2_9STRA|nr:hypothetical protein TL16_g05471 [Triparma laevis f. inornata]
MKKKPQPENKTQQIPDTSSLEQMPTPSIQSCRAEYSSVRNNTTSRISWSRDPHFTPLQTPPDFTTSSPGSLRFHLHAMDKDARASTVYFPPRSRLNRPQPVSVPTPVFMPVGTKGTIKGMTYNQLTTDPSMSPPIILGNTYHLALDPGTDVLDSYGGLHNFSGWPGAMLTDSGGFQMVSLLKLASITEAGVAFQSPYKKDNGKMILLKPEESIRTQVSIGADVMMQLDDVVSSVRCDDERFEEATYRTLRWLDRCLGAATDEEQNMFAIVQGGLDVSVGGLREVCLEGFKRRDSQIPGYAIGGLAGGEGKDEFWRVVKQCCSALPSNKPRYLMGVGYPLDLVVCTALGVDMYDCVYPTRTGRFGVALVDCVSPGTMRLKGTEFADDMRVVEEHCDCPCCLKGKGYSRAKLHMMLKSGEPVAAQALTAHNIAYMMRLTRGMRGAILEGRFEEFVREFLGRFYPAGYSESVFEEEEEVKGEDVKEGKEGEEEGGGKEEKEMYIPKWVVEALRAAEIDVSDGTHKPSKKAKVV